MHSWQGPCRERRMGAAPSQYFEKCQKSVTEIVDLCCMDESIMITLPAGCHPLLSLSLSPPPDSRWAEGDLTWWQTGNRDGTKELGQNTKVSKIAIILLILFSGAKQWWPGQYGLRALGHCGNIFRPPTKSERFFQRRCFFARSHRWEIVILLPPSQTAVFARIVCKRTNDALAVTFFSFSIELLIAGKSMFKFPDTVLT